MKVGVGGNMPHDPWPPTFVGPELYVLLVDGAVEVDEDMLAPAELVSFT